MKTRFDYGEVWVDSFGKAIHIEDMETMHLLNVLAFFVKKPGEVMRLLLADVDSGDFAESPVWTPAKETADNTARSVANITTMTADALTDYALHSELGKAMRDELVKRGVNVNNALSVLTGKEFSFDEAEEALPF